ncbi:hypothetical protein B0H13DRAFT_2662137 [Mycena leptocephala]|nr:hypothetical protein B0H13DRAFT_2662137 [Mycena leptocephala]
MQDAYFSPTTSLHFAHRAQTPFYFSSRVRRTLFPAFVLVTPIQKATPLRSLTLLVRVGMFFNTFIVFAAVSSSALLNVQAHGTITGVTGANGVQAAGFGIIASTPRDGSTRKPFEQDTSIIRDKEIASGKTGVCGRTIAGGNNDVAAQLAAASQAGLPTVAADGSITMTLHQVNGDGAGPYTCDVSADGGNTFQAATVTQQVPGKNGRSKAKATDFALTAQIPAYAFSCRQDG